MILNEISIKMEHMSKVDVRKTISQFLIVCNKLLREQKEKEFYYADELFVKPFIKEYSIHDWLQDLEVPQKEKTFFRTLLNRGHTIEKLSFSESEFLIEIEKDRSINSLGGLVAYEMESFVVSFLSDKVWEKEWLIGTYVSIEDQDKQVSVHNCSSCEHVENIKLEEKRKYSLLISSGQELWDKRREIYPHLVFCDSVEKQLTEARVSLQIQYIMKKLEILEDYFAIYNGIFEKNKLGYGCRYESESVQKDENLKKLRKFKTPYGNEEYFYWHISFPGNYPGRIHFIPDSEHKVGIIGYIGKHLPTQKFRTI